MTQLIGLQRFLDYIGDVVAGLNLHENTKLNLNNAYAYLQKDRNEKKGKATLISDKATQLA